MTRINKQQSNRSYARREPMREPYDFILIVCEGSKSEPNYFKGLRKRYELSSANIKVTSGAGSDPLKIVEFAEEKLESEGYDKVFCVFDRNGHKTFDQAISLVKNSSQGKSQRLNAVTSIPCFEVWVLLHFTYTTRSFMDSGGRSACGNVFKAIQEHFPGYTKGHKMLFDALAPNLEKALTHARRLQKNNLDTSSNNPSTELHEFVDYLQKLKSQ